MRRSSIRTSPYWDLIIFTAIFGWEGPLGVCLGLRDGDVTVVVVGVLLTLFFWGIFGIGLITDCVRPRDPPASP